MFADILFTGLVQRGDFRLRQPQLSAQFTQDELRLSVRGGVEDKCVVGHGFGGG